jgi:large conductance mechanosensitive channel
MGFLQEFKEFAVKGNAMDMAVGIIIGGAFGRIVTALVDQVIMPVLGLLLGGVDVSNLFVTLGEGEFQTLEAAAEAGVATLNYGLFLQALIDFVLIALVLFLLVRAMNKLRRKEEAAPAEPPKPSEEIVLLREIRDNLQR